MSTGGGQWEEQRLHYNAHVKNVPTRQALQARRAGEALPLKTFHNEIKRLLIRRFAYKASALLDLACGRGGDLHKWRDARIQYVKGLDIADAEIAEATRRYQEMCAKHKSATYVDAVFQVVNHLGASDYVDDMPSAVVTCMFALHYFYVSESALVQFIKNVAANLIDGGYFLGTVPDGKRVLYTLDGQPEFKSKMLWLKRCWQGAPRVFDCRYICAISDTVTDGHEASEGSSECLVFFNALVTIAAAFGLHPVCTYGDPELDACFEEADLEAPFKHFSPNFPRSDPSLEMASRLNCAFVFQKRGAGVPQSLPTLPPPSEPPRGAARWPGSTESAHQQASKRARTGEPGEPPILRGQQSHGGAAVAASAGGECKAAVGGEGKVQLPVNPYYVDDDDDMALLPAAGR